MPRGELTDRIEADISEGTDWNRGGRYVNGPNPCQGHKAGCDIREASGDAPQTSGCGVSLSDAPSRCVGRCIRSDPSMKHWMTWDDIG